MQRDRLQEHKNSDFLLEWHHMVGEAKKNTLDSGSYSLQYYQGEYRNEYILKEDEKFKLHK